MKKKIIAVIIAASMGLGTTFSSASALEMIKDKNLESRNVLNQWKDSTQNKKEFSVQWDKKSKAPDFIKGELSDGRISSKREVQLFLDTNKQIFNIEDGNFEVKKVNQDNLGKTHYRTVQTVDGIPVYGGDIIVHTGADGKVYAVNGEVKPNVKKMNWNEKIELSSEDAVIFAEEFVPEKANKYMKDPSTELFLYEYKGKTHVVYLVELDYIDPVWAKWKIFVDAQSGEVIDSFNAATFVEQPAVGTGLTGFNNQVQINTVSDNGKYYLVDTTKPMSGKIKTYDMNYKRYYLAPGTLVEDADNDFNASAQKAAVSAHYYIGKVYDYYKNEYNRNSYDNNGSDIISNVHCAGRNGERDWNNAAWIGDQFVYGDGDGTQFSNLSDAFDVVAHEFTHGVTNTSSNLEYRFQSGALNEAISDIIGVAIENEAGDWLVGEDCYTPAISGDALRSMADPTTNGQPAHMDDFKVYDESYDFGGVHINSGIINKAGYNIGTVVGMYKMGQIFFRANTVYYTMTSDFDDARTGAIQAAIDLYGDNSAEKTAVENGFAAVGIGSGNTGGDGPFESNDSFAEAHGPLASGVVNEAYLENSSDDDYYYVDVKAAGEVSLTLTNLAGDYDLYLYNASQTQVAKSTNGTTSNESITYDASAAGKYYIKVIGYKGASSTSKAYRLTATYPMQASEDTWHYVDKVMESSHNYSNNENSTKTYSKAGAKKVAVHFVKIDTESGYDYIYIKDKDGNKIKTYDGSQTDVWAIVDGDTINVNLVSDYSINKYGYKIDQVGYFDSSASTADILKMLNGGEGITDETSEIESTVDLDNRAPKAPYKDKKGESGPNERPDERNDEIVDGLN